MKNILKVITLVFLLYGFQSCTDQKNIPIVAPVPPVSDEDWTFESTPMWEDDFTNNGVPDPSKWSYDVGGSGWGNNELQYYTSGNNVATGYVSSNTYHTTQVTCSSNCATST